MKLVIFGSTGRTGLPLVQQALDAGHEVVAFLRTPSKLTIQHENLQVVQGDAMQADDVARAITADVDAVLSVLGHTKTTPRTMLTVATEHMISAMKRAGVKRLVVLTGAGVSAPQDAPKFINHVIKFALKTLSGDILQDSEHQRDVLVRHTDSIDWTLVRGPMLTEEPYTGDYRIGWVGVNTGPRARRANIADFMLKLAASNAYLHEAPMISD